jgi:endogenous inhibitor of DNA gyrase (YacG/DUF329 family)
MYLINVLMKCVYCGKSFKDNNTQLTFFCSYSCRNFMLKLRNGGKNQVITDKEQVKLLRYKRLRNTYTKIYRLIESEVFNKC